MADTPQVELPSAPFEPLAQEIDTHGQSLGFEFAVVVVLDTTPPVVGNFVPELGSNLPAAQPIRFDVTDDSGDFRRIIVHARFADGLEEVIHNGDSFRGLYGGGNSGRSLITGGFQYNVFRAGGWPQGGPVAINVFAIDVAGNEAA